ncbi:class I SAM-dependent methyltransferase [Cryobacterium lactosi]|uniref:Class I SAM-dependent methyltransferase n=1 Tax=Cryobacterium lactosi TaxID=1259202 RepID=A0A4R9BY42_9MICO|nr:class I SAM-dependent methyltransferase [Cryobacterium lactosi]TFD94023.1 class I SAM-dependent methyltransferase [Cryobacterium lactosi]
MSAEFDREYWDDRYSALDDVWSGAANPVLVTETSDLTPGLALDIGCGEGADAIWLAGRGWQVTGVDFSAVALERAAARSRRAGRDPAAAVARAGRIDWQQHDFTSWAPPAGRFDLVTAQFMHLPSLRRTVFFRALADAVAPGGTLLIVGHDVSDVHATAHRMPDPDLFFSADEVAATLDPAQWRINVAESRTRTARGPDGSPSLAADAVVRASRL